MTEWYREHLKRHTDLVIPDSIERSTGNPEPAVMARVLREFVDANLPRRPVYLMPEVAGTIDLKGLVLVPSGLVWKVAKTEEPVDVTRWRFEFHDPYLRARDVAPAANEPQSATHAFPSPYAREANYRETFRGLCFYYGSSYLSLAEWLYSRGRADEAHAAFARAMRFGEGQAALVARGAQVAMRTGDRTEALRWALQAAKNEPANLAHRLLVAMLYRDAGSWQVAADEYDAVVKGYEAQGAPKVFRDDSSRAVYVTAARDLAEMVLPKGHAGPAISYYQRALIAGAPPESLLLSHLGLAFAQVGKIPEALAAFTEAVKKSPKDAALHVNLGLAQRDKGDLDAARKELLQAIALDRSKGGEIAKSARAALRELTRPRPNPRPPGP